MRYYPKNRIKNNQHTNGGEYIDQITGLPYVGFYHTLYNGKSFSGKDNSSKNMIPLLPINKESDLENIYDPISEGFITDTKKSNTIYLNKSLNSDKYFKITNINPNIKNNLPVPYSPILNEEDYNNGYIIRYFLKSVNKESYMEVDKDSYDKINNKESNYLWDIYIPFNIKWNISGDESMVYKNNYNNVLLISRKLKLIKFNEYLKQNYKKFYK